MSDSESDGFQNPPSPATTAKPKPKPKTASETYKKLSPLEHILLRPDTYIGSVEQTTSSLWVFEEEIKSMVFRPVTYVPGLYKIVDEILVNAADNKVRDSSMKNLKVDIDVEKQTISVYNDGAGIPVEMHATEKMWIPQLIFGNLLTSSNYDDDEEKMTGGRNGYGAKLANIYSHEFIVETADSKNGKLYKQIFSNNMSKTGTPKITDNKKGADWTKITFKPDLARFHMDSFTADTVALLHKRVYDMAGILKGVSVTLNGQKLQIKGGGFKGYVDMYTTAQAKQVAEKLGGGDIGGPEKPAIIYEKFNDYWEVAFAVSDGSFQQVSFCNGIATTKGGTHVQYIADQIAKGLSDIVTKKNSKTKVAPNVIKNHLWIFINCLIGNPAFDSQTKENMTLPKSQFGKSKCPLTEEFLKKVAKSGVVDNILSFAKFKQDQQFKKTDGSKRSRITGLTKLEDANNAGTKQGSKCTLILTEGDSAKSLAISGINVVGRDNYGVFPLRGKLLNVRDVSGKALLENAEIQAIKQIMGLQTGKVYQDTSSLRYGSLMIMADQDHDGSHIKGLIINFLDFYFPSLLKLPQFLIEFITPIVKATKTNAQKKVVKEHSFFTIPEYEAWKEETNDGRGYNIKYFKGLGTSTAEDAKKYFGNLRQHRLPFKPIEDGEREMIDMAFNKKKADNRKEWLRGFVPGTYMDHNVQEVKISDFINKELILFSMADNVRSIPSLVDGFKPGQRKVLFVFFKQNIRKEMKVAQLVGSIGLHSAYHHGEQSLAGTVVGLAQSFVGSNNINLLEPNGQFGTRLQGGKDAASARYIFTALSKVTRAIFHPADDNILDYLNDDGQSIEPFWYIPVLPMVLVNGSDGIGTGWSSTIPNYNPADIVANLLRKMDGEEQVAMHPWYRGFRGTIERVDKDSYKCNGIVTRIDDGTVEVTELPIRSWTQTYKEMLEGLVASTEKTPALVKDYKEYHTDTTVHFIIMLTEKGKEAIAKEGLEKVFKSSNKLNTGNMVVFDAAGKIKKFSTPEEILDDFYDIRVDHYHKRKAFLLNELTNVHDRLSNQARFIHMIIKEELDIKNRKKAAIVADLRSHKFRPFPKKRVASVAAEVDQPDAVDEDEEDTNSDSDYDYLLSMSLYSLTAEKVAKLLAERDEKENELTALMKLTAQDLWKTDLEEFSKQWAELLEADTKAHNRSVKGNKAKGKGKRKQMSDDDDDFSEPEYKPKPRVRAAPKPKPVAALPSDDVDMNEDAPSVAAPAPVAVAPPIKASKAVPPPAKKPKVLSENKAFKAAPPPAKKPKALSENDDDFWNEEQASPKAAVKAKKAPAPKKKMLVSDDDGSDLEVFEVKKPAKAAKASASKAKTVPAPKAATAKSAPVKKAKATVVDSEDDDSDFVEEKVVPVARAGRTARAAAIKASTYVDNFSDDEASDAGSSFAGDESD